MAELTNKSSFILAPLTFLVAITTFISALAPYANPQEFWMIAVLGLGFYYAYVANFIMLVIGLIKRKKIAFVSLIPFIAGLNTALGFLTYNSNSSIENLNTEKNINVMTYNVRIFDLYNWSKNEETRSKIFKFFEKETPDILCLQEFHTSTNAPFHNLDTLQQILKAKNAHILLPVFLYGTDYWGVTTYTKYPIIKKHTVFADKNSANGCIATDILVGNDTIRIYNAHLQSIRFTTSDYSYVNDIANKNSEEQFTGVKGIVKRLKKAFIIRSIQANLIAEHIKQCPYKIILCGDFNDTPASYTYRTICSSLDDAFRNKGSGFSSTYIGIFPAFRIDYILHSTDFKTLNYKIQTEKLSDHYAVKTTIGR